MHFVFHLPGCVSLWVLFTQRIIMKHMGGTLIIIQLFKTLYKWQCVNESPYVLNFIRTLFRVWIAFHVVSWLSFSFLSSFFFCLFFYHFIPPVYFSFSLSYLLCLLILSPISFVFHVFVFTSYRLLSVFLPDTVWLILFIDNEFILLRHYFKQSVTCSTLVISFFKNILLPLC